MSLLAISEELSNSSNENENSNTSVEEDEDRLLTETLQFNHTGTSGRKKSELTLE